MEITWKKKGNVIASFLQHEMSILTPWTKSQSIHDWGTLDNSKGDPPNLSQLAWLVAQHGWNREECSSWKPMFAPNQLYKFCILKLQLNSSFMLLHIQLAYDGEASFLSSFQSNTANASERILLMSSCVNMFQLPYNIKRIWIW